MKQQVVPLKERVSHFKGLAKTPEGLTDYSQDFFGKPTFLTVSGQLNAEMYATAMSDVYTFGEACPSCVNLSTAYSTCCLLPTLPAVYYIFLVSALFLVSTLLLASTLFLVSSHSFWFLLSFWCLLSF